MKNKNDCALCSAYTELCESHYLPQGLFKVVTHSVEPHDNAPVVYNANTETTCFTNFQPKMSLLFSDCEQKFSINGENEVIKNCYQSTSRYYLLDKLCSRKSDLNSDNHKGYFGGGLKGSLDVDAYYYFALSVLWRGSVGAWPPPYNEFKGKLGAKYTQLASDFLLDPLGAIPNIYVNVYVDTDLPSKTGLSPPSAMKYKLERLRTNFHSFVIPGARFVVLVGGDAKKILSKNSDTTQVTFYEWSFTNSEFFRGTVSQVKRAKPRGKLVKK